MRMAESVTMQNCTDTRSIAPVRVAFRCPQTWGAKMGQNPKLVLGIGHLYHMAYRPAPPGAIDDGGARDRYATVTTRLVPPGRSLGDKQRLQCGTCHNNRSQRIAAVGSEPVISCPEGQFDGAGVNRN